jgi:signal transduction histidine kinase
MGLERLLDDLATNPILAYVFLYDPALTVVAQTPSVQLATTVVDPFLLQALTEPGPCLRTVAAADGSPVLEVVKPFHLGGTSFGLLRLGLRTTHITELWRRSVAFLVAAGLGLLIVGGGRPAGGVSGTGPSPGERTRTEHRLARQDRVAALRTLAAGVAHEVRNPLNAISIGVQRLA